MIICEAECPACGEMMQFEEMGEKPCNCGKTIGELTIEWKGAESDE
ncbi:hypothetical protein LCGC14_1200020 [marine sediment metagenome]|uniref:Uncharacterized protein n=1 Tax=marine sediment metagenome TaxID=412755 RepID=A0A0F9M4G3_9ZZZZ